MNTKQSGSKKTAFGITAWVFATLLLAGVNTAHAQRSGGYHSESSGNSYHETPVRDPFTNRIQPRPGGPNGGHESSNLGLWVLGIGCSLLGVATIVISVAGIIPSAWQTRKNRVGVTSVIKPIFCGLWALGLGVWFIKICLDNPGESASESRAAKLEKAESWNKRGAVLFAEGRFDDAIADFTKGISICPFDPLCLTNRGAAKLSKGDCDGAIADCSEAIKLDRKGANAFYMRGMAKQRKGDLVGAVSDHLEAIRLNPDDANYHQMLALAHYCMRDLPAALSDLRSAQKVGGEDPYHHFLIWAVLVKLGQEEPAQAELDRFDLAKANASETDPWAVKIWEFLTGKLSEESFLAAALAAPNTERANPPCEAYFYVGAKRLASGDKTASREFFKKCVATQQRDFMEYVMAQKELE